jgi:hypothetical protein
VLALGQVRDAAAAALAPEVDGDPEVIVNVVDALQPPALMLLWDDPWLTPRSVSACLWDAMLAVRCVAGRVEPGPGIETLEQIVVYTLNRLQADAYTWPTATLTAPRVFTIGNIPLLFADVQLRVPVGL